MLYDQGLSYEIFDGMRFPKLTSLVIRQKGKSPNGCFKKAKHVKLSEKQTFPTP